MTPDQVAERIAGYIQTYRDRSWDSWINLPQAVGRFLLRDDINPPASPLVAAALPAALRRNKELPPGQAQLAMRLIAEFQAPARNSKPILGWVAELGASLPALLPESFPVVSSARGCVSWQGLHALVCERTKPHNQSKVALLLKAKPEIRDRAAHFAFNAALRLTRFRGLAARWPAVLAGVAALATLVFELSSGSCVALWATRLEEMALVSFGVGITALLGWLLFALIRFVRREIRTHKSAIVLLPAKLYRGEVDGESYGLSASLAISEVLLAPTFPAARPELLARRETWAATGTIEEGGAVGPVSNLEKKAELACHSGRCLLAPVDSVQKLGRSLPCVVGIKTLRQALSKIAGRTSSRANALVLATAFASAFLLLMSLTALTPRLLTSSIEAQVVFENSGSLAVNMVRQPPWPFMNEPQLRFLSDTFSNRNVGLVDGVARISLGRRPTHGAASPHGWVELALGRHVLGWRLPDVIVWRRGVVVPP